MNKTELIDQVASVTDQTKTAVSDTLEAILDQITRALERGDRVQLTGFGTFEVRRRKARKARNPQTGDTIQVPAQNSPAFKAGKSLKDSVN